jgi:hypothetical protein
MRRTRAFGTSTTLLVVLALLAGSASFSVRSAREVRALIAATFTPSATSVGRARGLSSEFDGAARTVFVLPASRSITRSHASVSGRSGDAHGAMLPGSLPPSLENVAVRVSTRVEARRDGVSSPGQPAAASRAPPVG